MNTRDKGFYDLLGLGLGERTYQGFVDSTMADFQNTRKTDGFDWSPDIQMGFTYEQIEAELGLASIPTFVDVDSPGAYKERQGISLGMGSIPRGKHGFAINEKILREEMIIAQRTGRYSNGLGGKMLDILFDSTSDLIKGNYAGLTLQRDQMVSTGMFELTAENNPDGLRSMQFKAHIPKDNVVKLTASKKWFDGEGKQTSDSNPIKDLRDLVDKMEDAHVANFHFEVDKKTFRQALTHTKVLDAIATNLYPATQNATPSTLVANLGRDILQEALERVIGAPIVVKNNIVKIEGKGEIRTFAENVWALVPDGSLGDIKAVQPIFVADPGARIAEYDGGRTVLKQWFDTSTNTQYIESELTALCVPSRPKHMFQLIVG